MIKISPNGVWLALLRSVRTDVVRVLDRVLKRRSSSFERHENRS